MPVIILLQWLSLFLLFQRRNAAGTGSRPVRQGGASAKFWLRPEVRLADSHGFDASTPRELAGVVEKQRDLIERIMNALVTSLRFDEDTMWVRLVDGRVIGVPLAWFPRLLPASPEQRLRFEISGGGQGLHWDELDEDISVAGLLAGRGDVTRAMVAAA